MKAIILSNGRGVQPNGHRALLPRPMLPIGDGPVLELLLPRLVQAGVREAVLTVGPLANLIRACFGNGERYGLRLSYCVEEHPLGAAGCLAQVEGIERTFFVINGDVLTTLDFSALLRFHRESGALATLAVHPRETPIDLQVVRFNGGGRIAAYTENPSVSHMAFMGVSVLEPEVLGYIQPGECLDFPGLVQRLLAAGCQVGGFPFEGYWMDLSRPADYAQAMQEFDSIRDQFRVESGE